VNNWNQIAPGQEKRHIPSVKVDQNLGDKAKLSFYASNYLYYANARNDALPAPITSTRNRKIFADTYQLHYDYTLTPTTLIHFGLALCAATMTTTICRLHWPSFPPRLV
jgi:hypothetical protein